MLILKEILKKYIDRRRAGIWCFNFHQVGEFFNPSIHMPGTFTALGNFEKYIKYIKSNFKVVSVYDAMKILDSKCLDERYACITFDDGDSSIEKIIPILISNDIPASFFINSAYVDDEKLDPFRIANYLINNKCNVDLNLVSNCVKILRRTFNSNAYFDAKRKLIAMSNSIPFEGKNSYVSSDFLINTNSHLINYGLHGHEHDRFIILERNQQIDSLKKNIDFVSKLPGYIPIFAIPFGRPGDWNSETISVCNDMKLKYLFANGGYNNGDNTGLRRIPADNRNLILDLRLGYYQ